MHQRLAGLKQPDNTHDLLRNSEAWYRLLVDNVSDVIWTLDLSLRFTYYSPSITLLRGYTVQEAMSLTLQETLTSPSFKVAMEALSEELDLESIKPKNLIRTRTLELEESRKDGSVVWVEAKMLFLRDQKGNPLGILGVSRDITERKQAEEKMKRMAFYDFVTGLPNRMLFNDRLDKSIRIARRNKKELALLMLDLDRFKEINDRFGHAFGDKLLRSVGKRLTSLLRDTDSVSRVGGDEFMILLPDIGDERDAITVADRVVAAFQRPFAIDSHDIRITASIGISKYPRSGSTIDALISEADKSMYQAKATGRNKWHHAFSIQECEASV